MLTLILCLTAGLAIIMTAVGHLATDEGGTKGETCKLEAWFTHTQRLGILGATVAGATAIASEGWPAWIAGGCALASGASVILATMGMGKCARIMKIQEKEAAILSMATKIAGKKISIWLRRAEEWPPITMDLGIEHYYMPASEAPPDLVRLAEQVIVQIDRGSSPEWDSIKTSLIQAGATHKIDVAGAERSPVFEAFFEGMFAKAENPGAT